MKFNLIHKVLLVSSAALFMVGCNKQPAVIDDFTTVEGNLVEYTIDATPSMTRTAMDNDFVTTWQESDAVTVFYQHNGQWRNAQFDYDSDNRFKGKMVEPDENTIWYVQYPYSGAKSPENAPAAVNQTQLQNGYGSKAHLAGKMFPLSGSLLFTGGMTVPSFTLNHDLSIIRFTITNSESSDIVIQSIEFIAPSYLTGYFSADLTSQDLVWKPLPEMSSNKVVLTVNDGTAIAQNGTADFYVGIMPLVAVAATGDYTIKVVAECGGETITSTKTAAHNDISFSPSTINTLTYTFIKDTAEKPAKRYDLVCGEPAGGDWNGQYLVLDTSDDGPAKALNVNGQPASGTETTVDYDPVDVEVVDGYVEWTDDIEQYAITVSLASEKYKNITPDDCYNFQNSLGKYIFCSGGEIYLGNTNKHTNDKEYTYYQAFQFDSSTHSVIMRSAQRDAGSSDQYYLKYSDGTFSYDKTNTNRVQIFKLVDDRTVQTISFPSPSITWIVEGAEPYQIGQIYAMPQTVSGVQTAVTYTSSNASVASISEDQIQINGIGETTITASAEESSTYAPATASYILVISPDPSMQIERDLGDFILVNSNIQAYLNYAESEYGTNEDWEAKSVMTSSTSFKDKNNYTIRLGVNGDLGDYTYSKTDFNENQVHTPNAGTPKGYDYPAPVTIGNLGHNGETAVVNVYNDSNRTNLENSVTTVIDNGDVYFYNLIPNRKYYYTVSISDDEIDRGYFTTSGSRRFLLVMANPTFDSDGAITNPYADDANNCRDFGGLRVGSNQQVKYGMIFRGTNIDHTKFVESEKETLLGYLGIRLDVDLRNNMSGVTSGDYRKYAKRIYQSYGNETIDYIGPGFEDNADLIASGSAARLKSVISAIFESVKDNKPVYIHCFAGADRTGYICCLLEAVLGVSQKDCSIDYELTSFSCVRVRDRKFEKKPNMKFSYEKIRDKSVSGISNPTFQQRANQIIRDLGISQTDIDAFKAAMIENIPNN